MQKATLTIQICATNWMKTATFVLRALNENAMYMNVVDGKNFS